LIELEKVKLFIAGIASPRLSGIPSTPIWNTGATIPRLAPLVLHAGGIDARNCGVLARFEWHDARLFATGLEDMNSMSPSIGLFMAVAVLGPSGSAPA
jgi:hypothetical protein